MGRRYFTCPACGQGDFGADRVLGLEGYLTAAARRMACLAGVQQSFAKAEMLLTELGGWDLDDGFPFLMTFLGGTFSFTIDDPGPGPHVITIFVFDDTGDLSESSVSFIRS